MLLLLACTGASPLGSGVTYTLQLQPLVPDHHDPFAELVSLELEIAPAVGEPTLVGLDVPGSGGTTLAESLPAFDDAVFTVTGYDQQGVHAYGRAGPLSVGDGDELVVPLLFAEVDTPGWLTPLDAPLLAGALISLGEGRFRLLGGISETGRGTLTVGVEDVRELSLAAPAAMPAFTSIGSLPTWSDPRGGTHTARSGFSMHRLTAGPAAGKWLLAGGSANGLCGDAATVANDAWYYDQDTGEFTLVDATMELGRELYASVQDDRGNVVYQGGAVYDNRGGCYIYSGFERFLPESERFQDVSGGNELGDVGVAATAIGNAGSLFCGGASFGTDGWESVDACVVVDLEGVATLMDPMPAPLAAPAAIRLASGEVLLSGGVTTNGPTSGSSSNTPAQDDAWLYVDGVWRSAGRMSVPRAGHRMALLPDGRVAIIGGAGSWGPFLQSSASLACVEVYDPVAGTFTPLSDCDDGDAVGDLEDRAQEPMVAVDEDWGVLVVGGANGVSSATERVAVIVPAP